MPPTVQQIFDKAPEVEFPDQPMQQGELRQPDDVKTLGELKDNFDPPMQARLYDSEVSFVPTVEESSPGRPKDEGIFFFPVIVTQNGGAQGDSSTEASWSYTVTDLHGIILGGTDVNPQEPHVLRPNIGRVRVPSDVNTPAYGVAFYQEDGNLILWSVGEAIQAGACP
jgi:hypothetical protein